MTIFNHKILLIAIFISFLNINVFAQKSFEKDVIHTKKGGLEITFIGHGSLMFQFKGKIIHIDPFSRLTDYSQLPKADLILITHQHGDHLDSVALSHIITKKTKIVYTLKCKEQTPYLANAMVMKNGDAKKVLGIKIEVFPAYNLVHKRKNGDFFHPKGEGNSYVLSFANKRVYIGGDTENTPEMKALKDIDIAFLPMNLPYTMTPEMVADAAKAFKPKILYPYHFGKTDTNKLLELMKDEEGIELRIRKMQ